MSLKEKASVAENQIIVYYKQTIIELEEKNRVLEAEINVLKDMNIRYYQETSEAKETIKELNEKLTSLTDDKSHITEKYESKIQSMFQEFFQEKK